MAGKYLLKVNLILGGEMLRAGMVVDKERVPMSLRKRDYVEQTEEESNEQLPEKLSGPLPAGTTLRKNRR